MSKLNMRMHRYKIALKCYIRYMIKYGDGKNINKKLL